jgi:hypothetical protein
MAEHGVLRTGAAFCGECDRPVLERLAGVLTGCPACDAVIIRLGLVPVQGKTGP